MSQNHLIKRQILEISFPNEKDSQAIQNRIRALFYQQILPEIEKNCDRLIPTNVLRRIERLEIDLGEIRIQHFEEDILKAFCSYFTAEMRNALQKEDSRATETGLRDIPNSTDYPTKNNSLNLRDAGTYSALEILENFALSGLVPWWAGGQGTDTLTKAVEQLIANPAPNTARSLTEILSTPVARKRLWNELQADEIINLSQLIDTQKSGQFWNFLRRWLDHISKWADSLHKSKVQLQAVTWDTVFSSLGLATSIGAMFQALFFALKAEVVPTAASKWEDFIRTFLTNYSSAGFHDEVAAKWKQIQKKLLKDEASKTNRERTSDESQIQETVNWQVPWGSRIDRTKRIKIQLQDGISIYNAGLVLLSPFLKAFFEHLSWTNERRFSHSTAQQRAVYLLQYLATGDTNFPEYQLPLNKLMAGLPIESLVELENPLLPEEMAAGDEMLEAVLGHAKNLGLKSKDGLRGSFLLREGLLRRHQNNWSLHVKAETYDIVLHQLPWSYQVIKLPWMPEPLFVEWQINL